MDEIQYPSNSYRSKQEQEQKRQVEKVTQGKVSQKKKPAGKQIMESFVKEDAGTIGSHILFDIIIPTIKDMISSGFHAALDMLLYGDDRQDYRRTGTRVVSSNPRTINYNAISQKKKYAPIDRMQPCEEIVFEDRSDAKKVLDELTDQIDQFGMVSAYDLYEAAGLSCDWTLKNWGWYDLVTAQVVRTRDGDFVIDLPRMISLKNR